MARLFTKAAPAAIGSTPLCGDAPWQPTPLSSISTTTGYTPSSFIGPISAGTPDNAVFFVMSSIALAAGDTFSTLTFYNLPPSGPVGPSQTRNTRIVALLSNNGVIYSSTFTTTLALEAQVMQF